MGRSAADAEGRKKNPPHPQNVTMVEIATDKAKYSEAGPAQTGF
jgi:hypothetical protein